MPTNINFDKKLGISGGTNIILHSVSPTPPSFADTNSFQLDGATDCFAGSTSYTELANETKATFSFWIKPSSSGVILSVGRASSTPSYSQFMIILSGNSMLLFMNDTLSNYRRYGNFTSIPLGVWQHFIVSVDLTNADKAKMYQDGVEATSYTKNLALVTSFNSSPSSLYIGKNALGYSTPFGGNIDEVSIWKSESLRSASDVAEIYNGGLPNDLNNLPTAPQPTTWFRMGENATWNGSKFVMTDVNGGYVNTSIGITPSDPNPTTDVPT